MPKLMYNMNVMARNALRLSKTAIHDALKEMLKNPVEHGNFVITIDKFEDRIELFNNMPCEVLEHFTYKKLDECLSAYQNRKDTNFSEGMTCYLFFPYKIEVGKYYRKSAKSLDGYYQYIDSESHELQIMPDNTFSEVCIEDVPYVNGWRLTIYESEQYKIDYLFDNLMKVLKEFYVINDIKYDITINGEKFQIERVGNFNGFNSLDDMYENGSIYYQLSICNSLDSIVDVFWRLSTKNVVCRINTNAFDGLNVKGIIILTDIRQFANENRVELNSWVGEKIRQKILQIKNENQKEIKRKEELTKFSEYRENYAKYLSEIYEVPKYILLNEMKLEENTDDEKLKVMRWGSEFMTTTNLLLQTTKKYSDLSLKSPTLFIDYSSYDSFDESDFIDCLNRIGYTMERFRMRFPEINLGVIVTNGTIDGVITTGNIDDFMATRDTLVVLNNVDIIDIPSYNKVENVVMPINPRFDYFTYDFNRNWISDPKEYTQERSLVREISILDDFAAKKVDNVNVNSVEATTRRDIYQKPYSQQNIDTNYGNKVKIQTKEFFVGLIEYNRGNKSGTIPFLFNSEDDKIIYKYDKTKVKTMVNIDNYNAFKTAVELIIENSDFPTRKVYPVFFYEESNRIAFYNKFYGIVAYNTAKFPRYLNDSGHKSKMANAIAVIITAAHELAHEFSSAHSQTFTEWFERFVETACKKDQRSGKIIYDIVKEQFK